MFPKLRIVLKILSRLMRADLGAHNYFMNLQIMFVKVYIALIVTFIIHRKPGK